MRCAAENSTRDIDGYRHLKLEMEWRLETFISMQAVVE